MRIGEVAARAGVSVRALRYYEEQHLLMSRRGPSGQRIYSEDAVERVRLVQQLYAAGLSSKVIVDLLPCVDTGIATADMLDRMATERDRIDAQIHELTEARDRLSEVIAAARASAGYGPNEMACRAVGVR